MRRVGVAAGLVAVAWAGTAGAQVAAPAPETIAIGDWKLAPVLEARVRGEYWHDLDGQDKGTLTERARLGVGVERGAIEGRVVFQDARLWDLGAASDTLTGPTPLAATGVYEAWGEAHTSGAHPSFLRVGRQAITWGEGRLLGASEWSPTGRTLDAARGRLVTGNWAFEALGAVLEDPWTPHSPFTSNVYGVTPAYGELLGARVEWSVDPLFAVDAYGLARLAQSDPYASLGQSVEGQTYTGALRLHGDGHAWTWAAEGAYQAGHADAIANPGVSPAPPSYAAARSAWATAGHVAYAFEHVALSPTVRLGGSYASGDSGGSTYHGFDPLLPDVHTWYGAMDLFTWSNEIEASARVTVVPFTEALAAVEYRYARLAEPAGAWTTGYLTQLAGARGNTSADLGHEIDAWLVWSPFVPVELTAGYSVLVVGDGARAVLDESAIPPPTLAHYAYLQALLRVP
ncbi:MAG TPA: alginate export family protein [Polyangiaceae bacterium]|nr:alginate export family protein [Polyangiaceae bacterium]